MLKDIFGKSPQVKILDFLADMPDFDYTIMELSKKANVSRPTLYKILPSLLKNGVIIKTREIGRSQLYTLNTKNPIIKKVLKLDFEKASRIAKGEESG